MIKKLYAAASFASRGVPKQDNPLGRKMQIMPSVFNVLVTGENHATEEQMTQQARDEADKNAKRLAPPEDGWEDHCVFVDEITAERLRELFSD